MFVKPASPDLIVRHPVTLLPLPAEGGELPDRYAYRRIRDGSVVEVVPKNPLPAKSAKPAGRTQPETNSDD